MKKLSIIFGFKNRDLERVERCLCSLEEQSDIDFEVVFVDYGSEPFLQQAVKELIDRFSFVKYVYSEMRGRPWNRSHALNIGARLAQGEILMTTDIDLIFSDFSIRKMLDIYDKQSSLHATCYYLPEKFNKWSELSSHKYLYAPPCRDALGLLMVLPREIFLSIGGFDEHYQFWGAEDEDLEERLFKKGFKTLFLDINEFPLYHQWHPTQNNLSLSFMPSGYWSRVQFHFGKNIDTLIRNDDRELGKIFSSSERPILQYMQGDRKPTVTLSGNANFERDLAKVFFRLSPGEVVEIKSDWKKPSVQMLWFLGLSNRVANRLNIPFKLESFKNRQKEIFWLFVNEYNEEIKDYAFSPDENKFYLMR